LIQVNVEASQGLTFFRIIGVGQEMPSSDELRERPAWYRELAERAGNPAIWAARLRTAKELEAEADPYEHKTGPPTPRSQFKRWQTA
jgi:hypothetical protein